MKNLKTYVILILSFMVLTSCSSKTDTQEESFNTCFLELEYYEKHVDYTINEFAIRVSSNCEWQTHCDYDWVKVTPEQEFFTNSAILHIRVKDNIRTQPRDAEIVFRYGQDTTSLKIHQAAFEVYLAASEENIGFGHREAEKTIRISSNCGWYASTSENWISIKPSTGLIGNFDMLIKAGTNRSDSPRNGQIRIWNDTYAAELTVSVSQAAGDEDGSRNYVDEYGIDRGAGITIGGLTWATVNCGYESTGYPYGKMFQWGRKNGQGYRDDKYEDATETVIADMWEGSNGTESPGTFYKADSESLFGYDWISEGSDDFWNKGAEENPIKNTDFDPCPEGWRIPTAFEFKKLAEAGTWEWTVQEDRNGYLIQDTENAESALFLPAGGRINTSDGLACDRNIEGYYWTISTSEAGSSAYLYFHSAHHTINSSGSRAGGCLVRCIQE